MKSLMLFLRSVYADCGDRCGASTSLDLKTVEARVKHEGESFLTITLPNFGKEFERALDQGYVDNTMFASFSRHGGLPRFLGGFLCLVFDRGTGQLLDKPSIDAIRSIRQLTLMFGKMRAICSPSRERAAFAGYVECEQEVGIYADLFASDDPFYTDLRSDFEDISRLLWSDLFSEVSQEIFTNGIQPKHGPGSTADGLKGNLKYNQTEWTDRLEEYFPFGELAFPNWRSYLEQPVTFLEPGAERPSKVISVPKTMKTPRIIAVEPTAMQYVQQGILRSFREVLPKHKLRYNMVGFDDQTPNQRMAQIGSLIGTNATLDLSEASDRVSIQHVKSLLRNHQFLLGAVMACRTTRADVPGYGVLPLSKFASMGSALCFPFEAMVFLTAVLTGIKRELNRPMTERDIKLLSSQVRIFGDDIIVPKEYASCVITTLELLGFKVNVSKSFYTGRFRESCGKEYYAGFDVSLTRVRAAFPNRRKDTNEIISAVSMRNQFFQAGYVKTVDYLDDLIQRFIPFPEVDPTSPVLGRHTWGPISPARMHPNLHYPLVRGVVVRPQRVRREINGWAALMKWFLKDSELPFIDRDHLLYSGRPASLTLKAGWYRPF